MFKKRFFLTLPFLLFFVDALSAQCAMCKAVVESGDTAMAEGVNNGITYLMIFPYLLIAVLFIAIYRYKTKLKRN